MLKKIFVSCLLITVLYGDSDIHEHSSRDSMGRADRGNFHIRGGYAYSSWNMQDMENFDVKNFGLNTGWAEFIYKDYYDPIFYPKFLFHYSHSLDFLHNPLFHSKTSIKID